MRRPAPRLRALAALYAATALVLGMAAAVAEIAGKPLGYLTREPAEAVSRSGELCSGVECAYAGALSSFGVLVGCAAAACCFVCAYLVRLRPGVRHPWFSFLAAGGALTTALVLDDLFMVHETVVPELIGGGEKVVLLAYLIAGSLFVFVYRRQIAQTNLGLLATAVVMMGGSVLADQTLDHVHLVEDGLKLFGLVTWAAYFTLAGLDRATAGGR